MFGKLVNGFGLVVSLVIQDIRFFFFLFFWKLKVEIVRDV